MQWLIQMVMAFVALVSALALSVFGLNIDSSRKPEPEVQRVRDCGADAPFMHTADTARRDC